MSRVIRNGNFGFLTTVAGWSVSRYCLAHARPLRLVSKTERHRLERSCRVRLAVTRCYFSIISRSGGHSRWWYSVSSAYTKGLTQGVRAGVFGKCPNRVIRLECPVDRVSSNGRTRTIGQVVSVGFSLPSKVKEILRLR